MNTATAKSTAVKTAVGFRHILFATDFSKAAAQAIPYVKKIAKYYDADLVTLHVRTPVVNPMTEPGTWAVYLQATESEDEKHRDDLLAAFAGIRTEVLIEEGGIGSCLAEAIKNHNIDLVVIGTRGRTGIAKLLLGSTAEEIFRTVACPVLTVGPHANESSAPSGQFGKILYATDFSPESKGAAAYAVSLAQEFQARLVLLHVLPKQAAGDLVSASDVIASSENLLRQVVSAEAEAWCKPEAVVLQGDPAERILDFAKFREPELIVLGVRQEKGVPGAASHLPIAMAHKIVSHATCPVLTVRH